MAGLEALLLDLQKEVNLALNSKLDCEIFGFRFLKGPWKGTLVLDVDTEKASLSALLKMQDTNVYEFVSPFAVTKKEIKK